MDSYLNSAGAVFEPDTDLLRIQLLLISQEIHGLFYAT